MQSLGLQRYFTWIIMVTLVAKLWNERGAWLAQQSIIFSKAFLKIKIYYKLVQWQCNYYSSTKCFKHNSIKMIKVESIKKNIRWSKWSPKITFFFGIRRKRNKYKWPKIIFMKWSVKIIVSICFGKTIEDLLLINTFIGFLFDQN